MTIKVKGYTKKDGTKVKGYSRGKAGTGRLARGKAAYTKKRKASLTKRARAHEAKRNREYEAHYKKHPNVSDRRHRRKKK